MNSTLTDHPVVCYGEILWDILPSGPLPGGAPMNVAYHLKKLGVDPVLITRTGEDKWGEDLLELMSKAGITVMNEKDPKHPTGLVYAVSGHDHEMSYDIVYPSAWDFIQWNPQLGEAVSKADYFVFGSLASRDRESRNTLFQLLESSKKKVFDINLRPPHFQRELIENLLHKTDLLKMNLSELEMVAGWYGHEGTTEDRMRLVRDQFTIETIIVTKGGDGASLLHEDHAYHHPGYKITVNDTIGSGDSFLAGFLAKFIQGATPEVALDFAARLGAFVATKAGGSPDYSLSEVMNFQAG